MKRPPQHQKPGLFGRTSRAGEVKQETKKNRGQEGGIKDGALQDIRVSIPKGDIKETDPKKPHQQPNEKE